MHKHQHLVARTFASTALTTQSDAAALLAVSGSMTLCGGLRLLCLRARAWDRANKCKHNKSHPSAHATDFSSRAATCRAQAQRYGASASAWKSALGWRRTLTLCNARIAATPIMLHACHRVQQYLSAPALIIMTSLGTELSVVAALGRSADVRERGVESMVAQQTQTASKAPAPPRPLQQR